MNGWWKIAACKRGHFAWISGPAHPAFGVRRIARHQPSPRWLSGKAVCGMMGPAVQNDASRPFPSIRKETNAMPRADVTQMAFAKLYPLLVNKAEKKGRTRSEVDQVTAWLTGYTPADLARLEQSDITYADFFQNAPAMNPCRTLITGKVCGVRVEDIEDPLMRDIRYLDKLIDELAKGKPMEQILRK